MSSNRKLTSLDQRIWHRSLRKRQKESSSSFISSGSAVLGWGSGLQACWTIVWPLNYTSSNHHHLETNSKCFTAHTAQGFEKTEVKQGIRIPAIGSVCQIDNVEQPPFKHIYLHILLISFYFVLLCFKSGPYFVAVRQAQTHVPLPPSPPCLSHAWYNHIFIPFLLLKVQLLVRVCSQQVQGPGTCRCGSLTSLLWISKKAMEETLYHNLLFF